MEIFLPIGCWMKNPQKCCASRLPKLFGRPCTFTKATQNEALLWKIAVLGMEKIPSWCRNIFYLTHTGILHSSGLEMPSGLRTFCSADAGRFRKTAKYSHFFHRINLRKIPECEKIFPSPDRWLRSHPVRVAESFVRSCNSVTDTLTLIQA